MTDLSRVLPHFPIGQFARLIPTLERHRLSTSDLLTLDAADIGKRTNLPLLDVKRLCSAVLDALHADLGAANPGPAPQQQQFGSAPDLESDGPGRAARDPEKAPEETDTEDTSSASTLKNTAASLAAQWQTISTLDPGLDRALGGGIPAGYVTEITGESGAGKTQFLLTLLLSVQLPPPHGLGRPALYISTEAPLSTRRLAQLLSANPLFQRLPPSERPSLDSIISTVTPDLESQDHILTFQVPVEVERRGIGLVVLDSVAANYRAEFERSAGYGSNMGARTAELVRLGMHLRDLAQRHNLAVVVANQVADRFSSGNSNPQPSSTFHHHHNTATKPRLTQESPLATRSNHLANPLLPSTPASSLPIPNPTPTPLPLSNDPSSSPEDTTTLLLDHQQRWFTGWGDDPFPSSSLPLKTPSLGLVWTTQLSMRIALFRRAGGYGYGYSHHRSSGPGRVGTNRVGGGGGAGWKRWMKVVFAAHARESGVGEAGAVEFEVWMGGVRAVGGEGEENEEEGG